MYQIGYSVIDNSNNHKDNEEYMAYNYTTIDGTKDGFVPGHGIIKDGKITTNEPIESPNLKLVSDNAPAPVSGTASQQNPNQPATAGNSAPTNLGASQ